MVEYITVQEASVIGNITEGYIRRMLIAEGFKDLKLGKDYQKLGKVWMIKKVSWKNHIDNNPPTKNKKA